ncbi:hypothetical protein JYP52_06075 [Nitratireductor aquibiodomus]|uniref:hypothetical protein n=1 Tax=Nitratireductor aquibiodomus TaxID=204799 RepID=UPI0019D34B79|nr:hypothetical protein [Nitratireductor aquibiodomus]MBN7760698.1 hypothetical protein [Nitratireductor aquibiodomus]
MGEKKALELLQESGFHEVFDMNGPEGKPNFPFADISAVRSGVRYLIGVKTRNKYTSTGGINPCYNYHKKTMNVADIAALYKATPAWLVIPVIPELNQFSAYFGTLDQVNEGKERYSIPTTQAAFPFYECLADGIQDGTLISEFSNGGFAAHMRKNGLS